MVPHAGILLSGGFVLLRLSASPGGVGRIGDDSVKGSGGKITEQLQGIALDDVPLGVIAHRQIFLSSFDEILKEAYGWTVRYLHIR